MIPQDSAFSGSLFDVRLSTPLRLDPGYRPLSLGVRNYRAALAECGASERVSIALEQSPESISRLDVAVFPPGSGRDADNVRYVTYILNGLLWVAGGRRATLGGPDALCKAVAAQYTTDGRGRFETEIMGQAFGRDFQVLTTDAASVPQPCKKPLALGGHLDGFRIGFDLGASDYKVAAVKDGEVIFSTEIPWNPKVEPDPDYHYERINDGLRIAASHMPRVDAIGGSSAGIMIDNQVMVASLFRAVPRDVFEAKARPIFLRLRQEWGVPLEVINDGDVTALAGGLSLDQTGILGIALGSSEAVGYLDRSGHITGWLNELAFAPVDANPEGGADDWSGNPGVGAAYFSQQAVDRLAASAGMTFPGDMQLPDRLKVVQEGMSRGDKNAQDIFASIGVYLGYTIPWYDVFYGLEHAMILGRVTSGAGGELILSTARAIFAAGFPELAQRISMFLPDEKSRRVGQAVAAASLPQTLKGVAP